MKRLGGTVAVAVAAGCAGEPPPTYYPPAPPIPTASFVLIDAGIPRLAATEVAIVPPHLPMRGDHPATTEPPVTFDRASSPTQPDTAAQAPNRVECAAPEGTYSKRYRERDGSCGRLTEDIVVFHHVTGWDVPKPCKGRAIGSSDMCEISLNYTCPASSGKGTSVFTKMMRWDAGGTNAVGVEQWTISFANGQVCHSTYDVTYTKQ